MLPSPSSSALYPLEVLLIVRDKVQNTQNRTIWLCPDQSFKCGLIEATLSFLKCYDGLCSSGSNTRNQLQFLFTCIIQVYYFYGRVWLEFHVCVPFVAKKRSRQDNNFYLRCCYVVVVVMLLMLRLHLFQHKKATSFKQHNSAIFYTY